MHNVSETQNFISQYSSRANLQIKLIPLNDSAGDDVFVVHARDVAIRSDVMVRCHSSRTVPYRTIQPKNNCLDAAAVYIRA